MKKTFLFGILALGAINVKAMNTENTNIDAQAIMTECGTIHQISKNATVEEAIAAIDYWTSVDC